MRSATGWGRTTSRSRSTAPAARSTATTATASAAWTATTAACPITSPTVSISGRSSRSYASRRWFDFREDDADYYKQPGDLFRLMTPDKQQLLFDNTARAMGDAPDFIKRRHVENCTKADPAYGAGVEAALRKLGAFASE